VASTVSVEEAIAVGAFLESLDPVTPIARNYVRHEFLLRFAWYGHLTAKQLLVYADAVAKNDLSIYEIVIQKAVMTTEIFSQRDLNVLTAAILKRDPSYPGGLAEMAGFYAEGSSQKRRSTRSTQN
jgi:hypothetical protein